MTKHMVLFVSYIWNRILSSTIGVSTVKNEEKEEEKKEKNNFIEKDCHYFNKKLNNSKNRVPLESVENLVFEGGGVKGIAFLGSLYVIKEQLPKIKSFAGTSVGSISATLLSIGYELEEIKEIMWNTDFKKFFDHEYDIPIDLYSIVEKFGICSGNNFLKWIAELIKNKTGNESYTFKNLWDDKKVDLVLTTTNVSYLNPLYISYRNYPDMAIKDGIRMSMSIPLVFNPIEFEGDYFADGGIIDNYPIHVFDGKYPGDLKAINERVPPNKHTLGFRLITDYDDTSDSKSRKKYPIKSVLSYANAIFAGTLKSTSRQYNGDRNWNRSIEIFTHDISSLDFGISEEDKKKLYQSGIDAALDYFGK